MDLNKYSPRWLKKCYKEFLDVTLQQFPDASKKFVDIWFHLFMNDEMIGKEKSAFLIQIKPKIYVVDGFPFILNLQDRFEFYSEILSDESLNKDDRIFYTKSSQDVALTYHLIPEQFDLHIKELISIYQIKFADKKSFHLKMADFILMKHLELNYIDVIQEVNTLSAHIQDMSKFEMGKLSKSLTQDGYIHKRMTIDRNKFKSNLRQLEFDDIILPSKMKKKITAVLETQTGLRQRPYYWLNSRLMSWGLNGGRILQKPVVNYFLKRSIRGIHESFSTDTMLRKGAFVYDLLSIYLPELYSESEILRLLEERGLPESNTEVLRLKKVRVANFLK